jgi:hypothetical protein
LEKPPTKKKIGMTWKIQVPSHKPLVTPTALERVIRPFSTWMMPMNQCPKTTAQIDTARRRST